MIRPGNFAAGNKGMVAVMVAAAIVVLFGFAAIVIDGSRLLVAKTELKNAADAASHAATRELGRLYEEEQGDPYSVDNETRIKNRASNVTGPVNRALGVTIGIDKINDVDIGNWNATALTFTPGGAPANAVRVKARRDSTAEGNTPVETYFARIWDGFSTVDLHATAAVAALTPLSQGNCCPFGISEDLLVGQCSDNPTFPVTFVGGCATWNTCMVPSNKESTVVENIVNQTRCDCQREDSIHYINGKLANAFQALNEPDAQGIRNYEKFAGCVLPVYAVGCSVPVQGFHPIVRMEAFKITEVRPNPTFEIDVQWKCSTSDGKGGGTGGGALSTMPKMVQCGKDNPDCS